jgi:ATP-binding cassette subfamily C protein LapB
VNTIEKAQTVIKDSLLDSLVLFTQLYHKPFSAQSLIQGLPIDANLSQEVLFSTKKSKSLFSRAAAQAGLKTTLIQKDIKDILNLQLPAILLLNHSNSCILDSFSKDKTKAKIIYPTQDALEQWVEVEQLQQEYLGFAFLLKKEVSFDAQSKHLSTSNIRHWFWGTLGLSRSIYKDTIIASILINLFVLATPLFVMNVYDRVIPNNAVETLVMFTIGIVVVFILDAILKFTRTYFLEIAAKKSDVIMSSIIFEKVLDLKISSLPKSVGAFASNIKEFDSIRNFFTSTTMAVLIDFPFVILFLAVIAYVGGAMVIVPIITIILVLVYAYFIKEPLHKSIEATHEAAAKKNAILIETLTNIETVKSQGMNGMTQYNWEEATAHIAQKGLKSKLLSNSIPTVTNFLVHLNTVGIICFGVYLIYSFDLTMGALIAVMILSSRAIAPMGQFASLLSNYEDTKTSYNMINEIMQQEQERPPSKSFVKRPKLNADIEFKNVNFAYPNSDVMVLNDVSFKIKKGEKVAFIGKIGSGKSTIVKLLLKIYEPTSGSILIDGIDITQIDPADLRNSIGYVPQDIALFQGTIKDNILGHYKFIDDERLIKCSRLSTTDEFVKRHPQGYDMPIGERGAGLSGGQRQSVGLARAFVSGADLLLLDEPTNAMDQGTENAILNNLKHYSEDKTLLITTQKMSMLSLTPRVIVMHEGKKVLDGAKQDVLKQLEQ